MGKALARAEAVQNLGVDVEHEAQHHSANHSLTRGGNDFVPALTAMQPPVGGALGGWDEQRVWQPSWRPGPEQFTPGPDMSALGVGNVLLAAARLPGVARPGHAVPAESGKSGPSNKVNPGVSHASDNSALSSAATDPSSAPATVPAPSTSTTTALETTSVASASARELAKSPRSNPYPAGASLRNDGDGTSRGVGRGRPIGRPLGQDFGLGGHGVGRGRALAPPPGLQGLPQAQQRPRVPFNLAPQPWVPGPSIPEDEEDLDIQDGGLGTWVIPEMKLPASELGEYGGLDSARSWSKASYAPTPAAYWSKTPSPPASPALLRSRAPALGGHGTGSAELASHGPIPMYVTVPLATAHRCPHCSNLFALPASAPQLERDPGAEQPLPD